jgi:hypothetical protein
VSGNGEFAEGTSSVTHSNDGACSLRTNLSNKQISEMNMMMHEMHKMMTQTYTKMTIARNKVKANAR